MAAASGGIDGELRVIRPISRVSSGNSGVAPMLRAYAVKDGAPAGDIATDGELASPPYLAAGAANPTVVIVTRNIAKGAMLSGINRASETPAAPGPPASPPPAAPPPGN